MSNLPNATYTVNPNPPAPIRAAITTIDRANINVWFTPAIIVFSARGNSILCKILNFDNPKLEGEDNIEMNKIVEIVDYASPIVNAKIRLIFE